MTRLWPTLALLATTTGAFAQGLVPVDPTPSIAALSTRVDQAQASADASVKTVNSTQPTAGNVTITVPDVSGLASSSTVTSAIASEATARDAAIAAAPFVKTVNSLARDGAGNVVVPVTAFVSGFTGASPGTVALLMSTAPCNAGRLASYAVVSDLYGGTSGSSTNEVLRCGQSGSIYYWRPQRTDYSATVAYTGGALALNPLMTPPVLYLTGTMTSNGTITPSTTNAYPGQQFTIVQTGALGLFSLQIGGLLGSSLGLLTGGTRTLTYSCTAAAACGWQGN